MIQTQFKSQTVFLVDDFWDGTSPLQAEFSLLRDVQTGLTKRESRRPFSASLRVSLKYDATVHGAALRRLQGSLRALNTQPVIVPFWPAVSAWADRWAMPISGGLKVVWTEDWSRVEILDLTGGAAEPMWPDFVAPALYGFLKPTEPALRNPDSAKWSVEFTESSPRAYALQPVAFNPAPGPQPPGYSFAPPIFPFAPDFSAVSEEISVEIKRDTIGFAREQNQTFYSHAAARSQKAQYTLGGGTAAAQLLRFFLDMAAPGSVFWASGWMQVAPLVQDAGSNDTVLQVEDTAGINVGDYITLSDGETSLARRTTARTADTITLDTAPGIPLDATATLVLPLSLARLDKPLLSVSWKSPASASCEIQWTEVPTEVVPAADEIVGGTLGRLPVRVVLFDFIRDLGNGTVLTDRFTNYETDLAWDGNAYPSQKGLAHGDITQTLNFENGGVELTSFFFPGNPLALDVALKSEAPLWLVIRHAEFDGATVSNAEVVFTGQLESVSRAGAKLSPKFNFGPASLDDQLPRMIRGEMCNHVAGPNPDGSFLVSYGCTLLKANWHFTATVIGPVSSAFPYALDLSNLVRVTGPAPHYFADWFALGWIESGEGAAIQRRLILKSTTPAAGALSLTMQRRFDPLPQAGDTVHLYPGCDGMFHTCKAYDAANNTLGKFGNDPNFGGEPFCPIGNPSLTRLNTNPPQGAKK